MRSRYEGIGIIGLGSATPPNIVGNEEIAKCFGATKTAEEIVDIIGIRSRHIAPPGMKTSDIALEACWNALEDARRSPKDIGGIYVGTNTPDHPVPSLASFLHGQLGIPTDCSSADIRSGCASFVCALEMAKEKIASKRAKNVLVVGADLLSRITSPLNDMIMLAGDGAGAAVVSSVPDEYGFKAYVSSTDGTKYPSLLIPQGGTAEELTMEGIRTGMDKLQMESHDVYVLGVAAIVDCVRELAEIMDKDLRQIHAVYAHQANWKMISKAAEKLKMSIDQFPNGIGDNGNCSAASTPMLMDAEKKKGRIKRGDVFFEIAFGAGFSVYGIGGYWA